MKLFGKLITLLFLSLVSINLYSMAQEFAIIPEKVDSEQVKTDVKTVGGYDTEIPEGSVWDRYKKISNDSERNLGDRMASGILSWDTLLEYVVYLVKFLSQIGLLIGGVMIVYAGYQYASDILGGDATKGKTAIKYAVIGVIVISFSYAIMKILTNMFIE